jgi:hypothetical protein
LKQGARSVEEYYQELQNGMLSCNLEEREDVAMARFFTGLNREIQDILEYKDYANITHLFHFACKAERQCRVTTQVLHIHLAIQCLFNLFLLVLRLLAGQVPSWLGCHAPQDHVDHRSWCIGH